MRHDWILDVLADLRSYASKNGLVQLAAEVDHALDVARHEIAAAERNDGGSAPPTGHRH